MNDRFYFEIVRIESGEVVTRIGPMSLRKAEAVDFGANTNLNHDQYEPRIVKAATLAKGEQP